MCVHEETYTRNPSKMLRLLVASVLISVSLAMVPFDTSLNSQWEQYKTDYSKTYTDGSETARRLIWESNVQKIERHNRLADEGVYTYTLGMNKFADLTPEEFRQKMNGFRMPEKRAEGNTFLPASNTGALPKTVDWRKKGYVTPIKDQGQCGSCWAFSATGSLEGQHFKKTGKLVSLSEQNLVDCSGPEGNMGCEGGLMDQAFAYIKKNKGIDTEKSYPYEAMDDSCRFKKSDVGATDKGFTDITQGSEKDLEKAVAEVGPISVAIDASHDSFQLYKSGVYNEPQCSTTQLDHGVLAVGYGALGGKDYWLVKNSWGTEWGMKGYIFMSRNKSNQCGIATLASYPNV
ncbi:hypothetical protein ScPMuIL_003296 [Solemya velum]